jgi:hypothetical protein
MATQRPEHLFLSSDGDLHDTRKPTWASAPIRTGFARTHRTIRNGRELRATLRAGGHAWPGGYPIVLHTSDGEMVSPVALMKNKPALWLAIHDVHSKQHSRIVGADVYLEGPTVQCVYTNADIESAYGDPDETTND